MASCSGNGSRGHHKFTLNVSESYISGSSENYSDVSWELVLSPIQNGWDWYYSSTVPVSWSVNIGGNSYTGNIMNYNGSSTVQVGSGSTRIYHNNDGSKSINFSFSVWDNVSANYLPGSANGNGSMTLTNIARASGVSCSSPYIGDTATITIDRKSSSFTHTVTYHILDYNSLTGTIADKTSSTVLSFNTESLKSQIYSLMPNAKSIAGTIRCRTYSGNTKIGDTQVANFNLYAKENECKPTVSGVVIDTNQDTIDLTGDNSILVKNASKPKVTVSATPKYSSTISGYSINLNDGQTSNNRETTFNTINSNSITVSATDSRGYSNSYTIDLSNRVINYIKLAFNEIDLQRPESTSSEVILNADGAFYNGTFKNSSQLNLRNIRVGDDLSGKTLYFDIPEDQYLDIPNHLVRDDENFVIVCDYQNNYLLEQFISSHSSESGGLYLYHNGTNDTTIYEKSTQGDTTTSYTNLTSITLPNDFGTVLIVYDDTAMYEHIYIEDDVPNTLACSYMYRESGASTWIDGGTLTPTITNNTFRFTNVSLGNVFDYEKEYQFKIVAQDLLMTVGSENKDIHVVTKGIAVVEIGDGLVNVNGDFTINDKSTDYIVESGTSGIWKYRKWNSGLAECWGTHTQGLTTSRTWGSLYRGEAFDLAYPFTFAEVPQEIYGFSSNVSAIALTYSQNNTTRTTTYNAVYYQNTTIEVYLNLYVRGRWK